MKGLTCSSCIVRAAGHHHDIYIPCPQRVIAVVAELPREITQCESAFYELTGLDAMGLSAIVSSRCLEASRALSVLGNTPLAANIGNYTPSAGKC